MWRRREWRQRIWELILYCCVSFEPSENFKKYLAAFLLEHSSDFHITKVPDKDDWVGKFSGFCLKNLRRTFQNGARAMMPSTVELMAIRVRSSSSRSRLFGALPSAPT